MNNVELRTFRRRVKGLRNKLEECLGLPKNCDLDTLNDFHSKVCSSTDYRLRYLTCIRLLHEKDPNSVTYNELIAALGESNYDLLLRSGCDICLKRSHNIIILRDTIEYTMLCPECAIKIGNLGVKISYEVEEEESRKHNPKKKLLRRG